MAAPPPADPATRRGAHPDPHPDADAADQALGRLLHPLARLALAQGITHAALDGWLKQALVAAADAQLARQAELPPHRRASRIATATGIHRREVTRLVQQLREGAAPEGPPPRSHAAEVFARWRSDPLYLDLRGSPRELPRQGEAASFEALAQSVTRDVHPRSLLDELQRLGLAALDSQRDSVRLLRETFVPHADRARMLRTLGANVGSHLSAAVDNVLLDHHRHFEQALYAQGLTDAGLAAAKRLVEQQWQRLLQQLLPELQRLLAEGDAAAEAAPPESPEAQPLRHHLRLGLYAFDQPQAGRPDTPAAPAAPASDGAPRSSTSARRRKPTP